MQNYFKTICRTLQRAVQKPKTTTTTTTRPAVRTNNNIVRRHLASVVGVRQRAFSVEN